MSGALGGGTARALLCETCGYVLDGLPAAAACPECGRAVAESLPGRRRGSPWQQRPSLVAWVATNRAALARPRALFDGALMERRRSRRLADLNLLLGGALIGAGWAVQIARLEGVPGDPTAGMIAVATAITMFGAVGAALMLLGTWIESLGIRFFGRRRGWRITRDVAWAVCGHASVGWTLAGALWFGGALASWALGLSAMVGRPAPGVLVVNHISPWWPMLAGLFAGLMVFEVLVNIGVRRCRYTNGVE